MSTSGALLTFAAEKRCTSNCGYFSWINFVRRSPIERVAFDCMPVTPSISGSMITVYFDGPPAGICAPPSRALAALSTATSYGRMGGGGGAAAADAAGAGAADAAAGACEADAGGALAC